MDYGFFSLSEMQSSKTVMSNSTHCGACGLKKYCKSPNMSYHGKGKKKILVIGEAPGKNEDEANEQFVGQAGKRLRNELKKLGIDLNNDCWKTNAIRCRPKDNKTPSSEQIKCCRPALFDEIHKLKPESILLFGASAAESVLGYLWDDSDKYKMETWVDWQMPNQELNCWISVHYHPSYLERSNDELLNVLFRKYLKKAIRKTGRPYVEIPNYSNDVELIYKEKDIILALKDLHNLFAFDYETNALKPEYHGSKIVSCAFSDGKKTFAFPWSDGIVDNVSEILKSKDYRKIASNMKFEERWTVNKLGHRVSGWDWDTMLAAHTLNSAGGVTGLKFQSFVQLGQTKYDKYTEPYLKAVKGNHINRIHEISLKDLLVYNGLDALLEFKLAQLQKRKFKDDK